MIEMHQIAVIEHRNAGVILKSRQSRSRKMAANN